MPAFRSLLYREPRLYDLIFPDAEGATARMVRTAIDRHCPAPPRSLLDVGCGTGRLLETLAPAVAERWGLDLLPSNIAYARAARPGIEFRVGDMRSLRLLRAFDVITCLGNALSYALTDGDLRDAVATFAAHAHGGTLLVMDPLNARAYLEGGGFQERIEGHVDTAEFKATSVSLHALDRRARILRRVRTWHIEGQPPVEDYAEYRLLFPEEVRSLLEGHGWQVLGFYDNRELEPTELRGRIASGPDVGGLRGRKLYTVACKGF